MKKLILTLVSCLILACSSKEPAAPTKTVEAAPVAAPTVALRTVRLLVVPFSDVGRNGMSYYALGLPLFATSRFEELSVDPDFVKTMADAGIRFEIVTGPHVLPEASAKLVPSASRDLALDDVYTAAKNAGATHVLTGWYTGRVEMWSLQLVLYEVGADGLKEVSKGVDTRKIFAWGSDVPKPARPGVQIGTVHEMFGGLIAKAFATAKVPLSKEAVAALSTPETPDAVSFIDLSRAYQALFLENGDASAKKALEEARKAVNVWPDYRTARRLYAWLLWQSGSTEKARLHFQEVIRRDQEAKPPRQKDFRSLVSLAEIDLSIDQPDAAREELEEAATQRPNDPSVHYWLGMAYAKLGRMDDAIAAYERSRTIDPLRLDARRALADLYAAAHRYDDAAKELKVVVEREPKNVDALYLLAACERAAGHLDQALATYDLGLKRSPDDAALTKLKKQAEDGVGAKFSAFIDETETLRAKMETDRAEFQAAVNDGTWLLVHLKPEEACADGFAGSDYLFAKAAGNERYKSSGLEFEKRADHIRAAFKDDVALALTPDESAKARDTLFYEEKAHRDYDEMLTAFNGTFKPLLESVGCDTDPGKVRVATIDEIRDRNAHRVVDMPEPPKRDMSGISPVVPTGVVDSVTFYVRNDTSKEIVLVLDGKPLTPSIPPRRAVRAGEKEERLPQYSTPIGRHTFCHVPKDAKPECVGQNVRTLMIDEGMIFHLESQ